MSMSLLSQIRQLVTVDVDSMDPAVAIQHTTAHEKFCDMTSNQAIVYGQCARPDRISVVKTAIEQVRAQGVEASQETFMSDVIDDITVLLAKEIYPFLTGNVHAQTSVSAAYDTAKTIEHAQKLVALFGLNGIPKERVCIKIPATAESMVACQRLSTMGIQTLATCLFSLPQALAAHQAGCLYIAPYFNELRVHFEPPLWKEYPDTAREHPMAPIIHSIVHAYKQIGSKTLIMPASIVTANEVVGLVSLSPDHLTLSGSVLDQLAALPALPAIKLLPSPVSIPDTKGKDFLADGGALLRDALVEDIESTRKLQDALRIFGECEQKTKEYLRSLL